MPEDSFYRQLTTYAISTGASGDLTVASMDDGRTFHVMALSLIAEGATDLTFKSGSTEISGPMEFADTDRLELPISGVPYLTGRSAGDDFIVNNSAAVQISGFAQIFEEAT